MVSDKLKDVIFKKLSHDLVHVEVIKYGDALWLIDRENQFWFLRYSQDGKLWWRRLYFEGFFELFSLPIDSFIPIICDWAQEVLNIKSRTGITETEEYGFVPHFLMLSILGKTNPD